VSKTLEIQKNSGKLPESLDF
jgi:prephenate dehydratase